MAASKMKKPPASISEVRTGTSLHGRQRLPPGPAAGPQAPKSCPTPKPPRVKARAGQPTLRPAMGGTHCPLRLTCRPTGRRVWVPAVPSQRGWRPSRTGMFGAAAKRSECRALLMPLHGARTAPAPSRNIPASPAPHAPHLKPPTHPCHLPATRGPCSSGPCCALAARSEFAARSTGQCLLVHFSGFVLVLFTQQDIVCPMFPRDRGCAF